MNLNKKITRNNNSFRIHYTDPNLIQVVSEKITSWLPTTPREYVIVFIGTDRSTGDSLGPLAGTNLNEKRPMHINVYGTLHDPVHATNLKTYKNKIYERHRNPFIIAIDACLGKMNSVGQLICGRGPIQPGAALNKSLPLIGDLYITGVVNISGFMEYAILQNTRLSLVRDMANEITNILITIDEKLTYNRSRPAVLSQSSK